jgi:hypothetical protein
MFALQITVTGPTGQVLAQGIVSTVGTAEQAQALAAQIQNNGLSSAQLTDGSKVHLIGETLTANSVLTLEIVEV